MPARRFSTYRITTYLWMIYASATFSCCTNSRIVGECGEGGQGAQTADGVGRYCAYGIIIGGIRPRCPVALPNAFETTTRTGSQVLLCSNQPAGNPPLDICSQFNLRCDAGDASVDADRIDAQPNAPDPSTGLGDPCIPASIPFIGQQQGFAASEVYFETMAAQCRTQTCVVYRLGSPVDRRAPANPTELCSAANPSATCVEPRGGCSDSACEANALDRVFCTCRCRTLANAPSSVPLCSCGEGFHCLDLLDRGDPNITGGYCIPRVMDTCTSDNDCLERGPGRCDQASGRCVR